MALQIFGGGAASAGSGTATSVVTTTAANSGTARTVTAPTHGEARLKLTLTGNATLTFNGGTAGEVCAVQLHLIQDGVGSRTVTWPSNIDWGVNGPPVLSTATGKTDRVYLTTDDGGASWQGALVGNGYTSPVAPSAPTALAATSGTGQITLGWTQGASNGSAVTQNKIYRSTSTGTETLLATISAGTSYVDTAVINGTAYFYKVSAVNTVGEGALSGEASMTPGIVTLAADDFNGADSASSVLGRATPTGAKTWTRIGKTIGTATWGISANKAYKSVNLGGSLGTDVGAANCTVSADCTPNTGTFGGLILRWASTTNYARFAFSGGSVYLQACVAGVEWTTIGSYNGGFVVGTSYNLKVVMSGSTYTAFVDGVQRVTGTNSTAAILAATTHGIYADEAVDTTARWDNFLVTTP